MLPFGAIEGMYRYRKNLTGVDVSQARWTGPWWRRRCIRVHLEAESAYELGRVDGWCKAVEEIYELEDS